MPYSIGDHVVHGSALMGSVGGGPSLCRTTASEGAQKFVVRVPGLSGDAMTTYVHSAPEPCCEPACGPHSPSRLSKYRYAYLVHHVPAVQRALPRRLSIRQAWSSVPSPLA